MLDLARRLLWAMRLGLARRLLGTGPAPGAGSPEAERLMYEAVDLQRLLSDSRDECRLLKRDVEEARWRAGFGERREQMQAEVVQWLRSYVDKNIAVLARDEARAEVQTAALRPPKP